MNRTGLIVVLAIGVLVGVVFGIYPRLDLDLARFFFDPTPQVYELRNVPRALVALLVAPAFLAILGKLILPRRRMLISGRAALFLVLTLALGPGILANTILKDHWGRPRPAEVTQLGGTERFVPWWDPRGACPENCSFVAGEPSGAFWTLAPAALAPPQWRPLAYGAALVFGAATGVLRMVGGGHFFTDVVFAGVFTFLLVWTLYGLIYRWRPTRLSDGIIERLLTLPAEALCEFAARARRVGRRSGEPS